MIKANEIPQNELLAENLLVLYKEMRELRAENEQLKSLLNLNCPDCGKTMTKEKENIYICQDCKIKAEQLTIFNFLLSEDNPEELGYFIKSQREAMMMNRTRFAQLLQIDFKTLNNYEKGTGNINKMKAVIQKIRNIRARKGQH